MTRRFARAAVIRDAGRPIRRGSLLPEMAIAAAMLMVAMSLTVKVLGYAGQPAPVGRAAAAGGPGGGQRHGADHRRAVRRGHGRAGAPAVDLARAAALAPRRRAGRRGQRGAARPRAGPPGGSRSGCAGRADPASGRHRSGSPPGSSEGGHRHDPYEEPPGDAPRRHADRADGRDDRRGGPDLGLCAVTIQALLRVGSDAQARRAPRRHWAGWPSSSARTSMPATMSSSAPSERTPAEAAILGVDDRLRGARRARRSRRVDRRQASRHESYVLGRSDIAAFERRDDGPRRFLALVVRHKARAGQPDPPHPLEVLALDGKDRPAPPRRKGGQPR